MRTASLWLVPWLALACAAPLPSARPLGEGPLFKAEALARAKREQVLAAVVRGDETEALAVVEPFDSAGLGGGIHG